MLSSSVTGGAAEQPVVSGAAGGVPAQLDIVAVADHPWQSVWNREQHLLAAILRQRPDARALLVAPAARPWRALRDGTVPRVGRGLRAITGVPGVAASQLWSLEPTQWRPWSRAADGRAAEEVRAAARKLGFARPVLLVSAGRGAQVLAATGWSTSYDIPVAARIAFRTADEQERLAADEAFLLAEAGVVLACSDALARTTVRPAAVLANAADVRHLRTPARRPGDLPAGPVALVVGTVSADVLDLELCAATASAVRGAARVVMVGPLGLSADERRMLSAAGVALLGPRPYRDIPAYLQHAGVLLAPYARHPYADQLDPVALYEYQAVGRPVVGTPVRACRNRQNVIVRAGDDFVSAVRDLVVAAPAAAPVEVSGWAERGRRLAGILDGLAHPVGGDGSRPPVEGTVTE